MMGCLPRGLPEIGLFEPGEGDCEMVLSCASAMPAPASSRIRVIVQGRMSPPQGNGRSAPAGRWNLLDCRAQPLKLLGPSRRRDRAARCDQPPPPAGFVEATAQLGEN